MGLGRMLASLGSHIRLLGLRRTAIEVAKFAAKKALLMTLITTVLVIVLNNFLIDWIGDYLSSIHGSMSQSLDPMTYEFTELGAYLATQLRLQDCLEIIISGISVGAIRKFLPFTS